LSVVRCHYWGWAFMHDRRPWVCDDTSNSQWTTDNWQL